MLENTDKEDKKAASTTTSPTFSKSENNPKKSNVRGQQEIKPPIKSKVKSQNDERSTTWTFIIYPESAPSNWVDILKELHVPFIVSPLHNKDVNDKATGELKKPHYHCIIRFRSKKSFVQIKTEICDKVNGPIPQPVADFAMMVRYLAHMDDPDKYQYDKEDIQVYGNIDIKEYIYNKREYQYEILKEILDFCEKFDIQEYSTIVNYAKDERKTWFPFVTKIFRATIDSYVRSQRYAAEHGTE